MGWTFRKSINLGPLRVNLSKSGVGSSWGIPGLRFGVATDGRKYLRVGFPGYTTLQAAYNTAKDGESIQLLEGNLSDILTANRSISVTFKGGYDSTYSAVGGETTINGQVLLRAGTVRMERVYVK